MREIPLTQGKIALVDDEDYEWLSQYNWCTHPNTGRNTYYACRSFGKSLVMMHRAILNLPKGYQCDHINQDGLDNRRANLRLATNSQNQQNKIARKDTSSRFKGVWWHKLLKKWEVAIRLNGKRTYLGYFNSEVEAAQTYDKAAIEYFGEFARLNFSDSDVANFQATSL